MDSPGSKAQPPKSSQTRGQLWIPSTLCAWPVMLSMSVAGASGKNSTTGAGGPRIPCTRPAGCLHTRSCLLTPRQQHQLADLFSSEEHVALEATWSVYQNIIDAYRAPDTSAGKAMMEAEINTLTSTRVPRGLTEIITLGRILKRRAGDILAYFDHPHTTGGPTEAINGRLEHLHGSALGLAQPHQLHRPLPPRNRRIQTPTTPSIMKSQFRRKATLFDAFCLDAPSEPLSYPSEAPISRRQRLLHGTTHPASTPQNRHRTAKTPPWILPGETGNLCIQNDVLMERMTGIEPA